MTQGPAENPAHSPAPGPAAPLPAGIPVNPLSLTVDEAARMLTAAGGKRVTPEMVQADIDAGAPAATGGKINLVHYTAWLVREVQAR